MNNFMCRKYPVIWKCLWRLQQYIIFITIVALGGCGGGTGNNNIPIPADAQGPFGLELISPSPYEGTVLSSDHFIITFTKPLKAGTVTKDTVGLWSDSTQRIIPTTIALAGRQITVSPTQILTPQSVYTLVATDELQSIYGESFEGLIVPYKVDGFELYRTSPGDDSTNIPADSNIILEFTVPVVVTSLAENFTLYDVTDNVAIPYTVVQSNGSYKANMQTVRINPDIRLPKGHTFEIRAGSGILSIKDEKLPAMIRTFTVSEKWVPAIEQDFYPGPDVDLDPYDSIVITFTQDIDPTTVAENDVFLRHDNKRVATRTTVSGPRVTITPIEPLKYGSNYDVATAFGQNSTFKDMEGVRAVGALNWTFKTRDVADEILLDFHPTHYATDTAFTDVYAYNLHEKSVARVNLSDFDNVDYLMLDNTPQSVCVTESHLYVLSVQEQTEVDTKWLVQEFDTQSLAVTNNETFRQTVENQNAVISTQLHCTESRVLLHSYKILYELHIDAPIGNIISPVHEFDHSITQLVTSEEETIVYAYDKRYRLDGSDIVKLGDLLFTFYWRGDGILQASDERNLLVRGGYIYQLDTGEVLSEAGKSNYSGIDEFVLAVDFKNMLWFAGQSIYSLEDYTKIGAIPESKGDLSLFDHYGNLYYSGWKSLNRVDHNKIVSGLMRN